MSEHQHTNREAWEGELFRVLVDNVQDYAIFIMDVTRRVLSWSHGAERILGYREEEILGKSADVFFTLEDARNGVPEQEVAKALATGRGEDDRWHIRKDGSRFWSQGVVMPLRDETGQLRGLAKILRDRTDLRQAEQARRESEGRKTAVLETALDAIITIDHQGKILEFNPAAERTFGWCRAEVVGREMAELLVPPALRVKHYRGLARYLATGEGPVLGKRIEMPALRADGAEFPVELAITRVPGEGPPLFTAYLRDITDRKQSEHRRNARLAVTEVLAQAASVKEATLGILQAVCEGLGWDVGALWTLDPQAKVLRCAGVWHKPSARVQEFTSTTQQRTFSSGVGLPGRVWSSGKSAWIPDVTQDDNFPRAPIAVKEGLHGAFAFPIVLGQELLGVIEFFSQQIREPDADLLEMMATIGSQVGQFLDRAQSEKALRDSEQRFARFMQHLPGLAWIKDMQGRYVYANDAALKAFRGSWDQLCGKTDEEVFPPETAAQFKANDRQALASGTGVQVIETLEHEDGVLHFSLVSKFPIAGPDAAAALVGGMAIDVTDRMRAEEELRESEEKFRRIVETANEGIWLLDANARIIFVNPRMADLLGYQVEEMLGQTKWAFVVEGEQERVRQLFERRRAGISEQADVCFRHKGGRPIWALMAARPVVDERGRFQGSLDMFTDVTERRQAEEALRQADRRKDEFLALLAHELRNPLTPIRNGLQVLKLAGDNGQTVGTTTEMMERQVGHMVRLIDDLLDLSRISRGKVHLRKQRVELAEVVRQTVEANRSLTEGLGHELTVTLPPEPLYLEADPARLTQVLDNLLNNACKLTEPGGRIWLTAEREGERLALRLRDTGIGIAADLLSTVFDMFVQADSSAQRSQGGLGIGLTLVKSLVEMHSGTVEAHSPGLGKGSEFIIRLPLAPGPKPRGEPNPCPVEGRSSGQRILVVDDLQDAADSLALLLQMMGHEVCTANDGPAALRVAAEFRPDVVLQDIGMPGMNGHEVGRRLREQFRRGEMVLVALTGYGTEEDRRRSEEVGFDHHLVKPVEPKALQAFLAGLQPTRK